MLGPLLFILFINDLPGVVDSIKLQNNINKIIDWTSKWLIKLNKSKCKVMHIGYQNGNYSYKMRDENIDHVLEETKAEKDLGVIISSDLKWDSQVNASVAKAQRTLGYIKRTFNYFDAEMVKNLNTTLVRPHLGFAIPVWNPYCKEEIKKLESVQRRAKKLAPELKNLHYEARLRILGLTTLENRRIRGDLIQQYKLNYNLDKVNWYNPQIKVPSLSNVGPAASVRGHKFRLEREIVHECGSRHAFFTIRIVPYWNNLPKDVVEAVSINAFKAELDNFSDKSV